MSLLDSFPHECTISKMNRIRDSLGGSKDLLFPRDTGVKCWEQSASNTERVEFQKRGIADARKIYFVSDPNVTERDEIKITKRDGVVQVNPDSFAVVSKATPDATAGLGKVWRVMVSLSSGETQ